MIYYKKFKILYFVFFFQTQVTAVTASSTGLKDPNVHEIIPATDMEKKLHELSGGQLQEGSNPFGMLKMLEIVFDVITRFFKLDIETKQKHNLVQAWATSGPRAKCGPPSTIMWPANLF